MNRARKTGVTLAIIVAAIVVLLAAAIYLRSRAAPEAARLLPAADTILYFNLRPVRLVTNFGNRQIEHEPDYEEFVRQTGIQLERDLDEAAFAIHSSNQGVQVKTDEDPSRYSEVFIGRFNSEKLRAYLQKLASSVEHYRAHDIYNIPHEGRTVRVSILAPDTVGASNTEDARRIHHIVEQYEKLALPFGGPELVRDFYSQVPFGSLAWLISDVPLTNSTATDWLQQIASQFLGGGVVVASLRYTTAVHLRADSFVSEDKAKDVAEHLNSLLAIYRRVDDATHPDVPNADLKTALDSIKIEPQSDRVSLSATLPRELVAKLFESPVAAEAKPEPGPSRGQDHGSKRKQSKRK